MWWGTKSTVNFLFLCQCGIPLFFLDIVFLLSFNEGPVTHTYKDLCIKSMKTLENTTKLVKVGLLKPHMSFRILWKAFLPRTMTGFVPHHLHHKHIRAKLSRRNDFSKLNLFRCSRLKKNHETIHNRDCSLTEFMFCTLSIKQWFSSSSNRKTSNHYN